MATVEHGVQPQEVPMKFLSALLLLTLLPLSAVAAQNLPTLPADRGPQFDPRSGVGSFDLLFYVDGEAIVYVKDDGLRYSLLSGTPLQNAGSNYSQPIPHAVFGDFNMEKIAGRGTVTLVETPVALNNFSAVVRIKDDKAGRDLYHIRLTWSWNPKDPSHSPFDGIAGRGGRGPDHHDERGYNDRGYNDRGGYNDHGNREGAFEFRGRVDGVTVLYIRGDQVRVENVSGLPLRDQVFKFSEPIPIASMRDIDLLETVGRGKVELVEKPWEGNRYTTVIRISDYNNGSGQYSFKLAWRR
jgi:hypothetical protein